MSNTLDDTLTHYGVPGMRWGVRRSRKELAEASEEASRAAAIRTKSKTDGTDTLSNKELQEAITRMNLEKQFATLVKDTTPRGKAQKFVESLVGEISSNEVKRVVKGGVSLKVESAFRDRGHADLADRIKPKKR